MYELLLEGREGAGAVRLGGWCQGRGRRWRCSLGRMVPGAGKALALFPLEIGVF